MCTLTWRSDPDGGYEVFFNRDEVKDREPAIPPREGRCRGVRYLAPVDPRGGGTWLAVNEFGVCVALLNWYGRGMPRRPAEGWKSRGCLVADLADVEGPDSMDGRIPGIAVRDYPPFRLIAFFPGGGDGGVGVSGWEWAGIGGLTPMDGVTMPVCSSSFATEAVIEGRRRRFVEIVGEDSDDHADGEALWRYHHDSRGRPGESAPGPWSVRMNRPDAQTWSISRVAVTPETVIYLYEAESLDLGSPGIRHSVGLPRITPG